MLLQKGMYHYEYMNDWKKPNETPLHEKKKKDSYSHLNMEDVTDENHGHAKRVSKDFEINNLG